MMKVIYHDMSFELFRWKFVLREFTRKGKKKNKTHPNKKFLLYFLNVGTKDLGINLKIIPRLSFFVNR